MLPCSSRRRSLSNGRALQDVEGLIVDPDIDIDIDIDIDLDLGIGTDIGTEPVPAWSATAGARRRVRRRARSLFSQHLVQALSSGSHYLGGPLELRDRRGRADLAG